MTQFQQSLNKDIDGQKITATYENNEWVTPVRARQAGVTDFKVNSVTVLSTAVELKADVATMSGRYQMIVYPPTAGTIYWGKSDVSIATGAPLNAGDAPLSFDFFPTISLPIYAVSDGTNRTVKVVEAK